MGYKTKRTFTREYNKAESHMHMIGESGGRYAVDTLGTRPVKFTAFTELEGPGGQLKLVDAQGKLVGPHSAILKTRSFLLRGTVGESVRQPTGKWDSPRFTARSVEASILGVVVAGRPVGARSVDQTVGLEVELRGIVDALVTTAYTPYRKTVPYKVVERLTLVKEHLDGSSTWANAKMSLKLDAKGVAASAQLRGVELGNAKLEASLVPDA